MERTVGSVFRNTFVPSQQAMGGEVVAMEAMASFGTETMELQD
jgi:hypothetical protein